MTGSFVDASCASACTGAPAFERRAFICPAFGDIEFICRQMFVVLCVGDGTFKDFGNDRGGSSIAKLEFFAGSAKILISDQIKYDPYFGSR
tara:strand:+ start:393 stop:665 length:273 start_codon:yes stop_codon:yes gene_type:complete